MFLFFTLFFCILFFKPVYAWDTNISHPNLTSLAVDLYNQNHDAKITDEQKRWMMEGALEEDMPLRWFNHFYDPVHNKGFKNLWSTSLVWAIDSNNQANYALGDNSWNRALVDFKKDKQKDAFIELGHTLHLIEDMLVPAHTRDDAHPSGDSLEQFVKTNWDAIEPLLPVAKINHFSDLNSIFVNGANYSNNNFYSDDTIESDNYKIIDVSLGQKFINQKQEFYFFNSDNIKNLRLFYSKGFADWKDGSSFKKSVNNGYILLDYSQHLLPQAIGNAAGALELFFSEAKKDLPKVSWFKISPAGVVNQLAGDLVTGVENLIGDSVYNPAPMPTMAAEPSYLDTNSSSENNISSPTTSTKTIILPAAPPQNTKDKILINPKTISTNTPTNISQDNPPIVTTVKPNPSTTIEYYNSYLNPYHENGFVFSSDTQVSTSTTSTIDTPTTTPPIITPTSTPTTTPETPTSTPPQTDTTPPSVPQISINNLSGFNSTELKINLSASDNYPGEIYFDLDYALAPTGSAQFDWQNFSSNSTSTIQSFFGARGQTYYFRARAFDAVKNYSAWSSEDSANIISATIGKSLAVVFNEIDWAGWGTSGDNNDGQWLELRNNTSEEVDLTNWKIFKDNTPLAGTVVKSKIAANGYYLIEASENAVGKTPADRFLSSGFLMKGNNLRLVNSSGEIIDEVNCSSTGWFAGNKEKLASMERISPYVSGDNQNNWRTAPGIRLTQVYSGDLFGLPSSPRITNSAPVILSGNQTEAERILTAAGGPYGLSDYIVPSGKSLKIEAGTIIKSLEKTSALRISGNLIISGTSTNRVIFTSGRDISDGTPAFGSYLASATVPSGDWYGIILFSGASANITGLDLRGAGADRYLGDGAGGFVKNGIYAMGANININDSVFKNNGTSTLNFESSSSTIYNSVFDGGENAIRTNNTNIDFNNLILRNYTSGLGPFELRTSVNSKMIWGDNIVFENNAMNRLYFSNFNVTNNSTLPALKYVVGSLTVNSSTLILLPGTDLAFLSGSAFDVKNGGITAQGTADQPVNIGPLPGGRAGFFNFRNSISHFNYTNFGAASFYSGSWYGDRASLIINSSTIDFNNTSFNNPNGSDPLILSYSSHLRFDNCKFYSPTKYYDAWSSSKAINAYSGGLVLKNSSFENLNYGFFANPNYTSFYPFVLSNLTFTNVDTRFYSNIPYPVSIGEPVSAPMVQSLMALNSGLESPEESTTSTEPNLDTVSSTVEIIEDKEDVVVPSPVIEVEEVVASSSTESN